MKTTLATRVTQVKPSATLAVSAKAQELRAQGKSIINLSVGEPDFGTPLHIKRAAIEAINQGFTKYTPVPGIPSLRTAIQNKFKQDNNLNYDITQIMVSTGAKQCLYNFMQAMINEGDEVIIPAPYWVSYPDIVLLAGGNPIRVKTAMSNRFKLTAEQLDAAITDKTRLIILNSPSNPTGVAYTKKELAALSEVLLQYPDVMIISDDIYEHILWHTEPFSNILMVCPQLYDRTVVINGVSKAYAMTGWRIGYAASIEPIIKAMTKIQSQSTSNPNSIAQVAAEAALVSDQACVREMTREFKQRHDRAIRLLRQLPEVYCQPADGAFYLFADVSSIIEKSKTIHNDVQFAEMLLTTVNVAVVPGTAFGIEGCIRLSIAVSEEDFAAAIKQIEVAISSGL